MESWGNHGGIMGESWENHGGIMWESWGNHFSHLFHFLPSFPCFHNFCHFPTILAISHHFALFGGILVIFLLLPAGAKDDLSQVKIFKDEKSSGRNVHQDKTSIRTKRPIAYKEVSKFVSFTLWSFAAFKRHLGRFQAGSISQSGKFNQVLSEI